MQFPGQYLLRAIIMVLLVNVLIIGHDFISVVTEAVLHWVVLILVDPWCHLLALNDGCILLTGLDEFSLVALVEKVCVYCDVLFVHWNMNLLMDQYNLL